MGLQRSEQGQRQSRIPVNGPEAGLAYPADDLSGNLHSVRIRGTEAIVRCEDEGDLGQKDSSRSSRSGERSREAHTLVGGPRVEAADVGLRGQETFSGS